MKILILEDDIKLSLAMKQELLRNDYMVDCCHDGETGLLYALNAEFGYDLAIVDRMLPVIDGLTIIKAMRKKGISVPVIIITGMSSIDDRIDGLDGGADDLRLSLRGGASLQGKVFCVGDQAPGHGGTDG